MNIKEEHLFCLESISKIENNLKLFLESGMILEEFSEPLRDTSFAAKFRQERNPNHRVRRLNVVDFPDFQTNLFKIPQEVMKLR